MDTAIYWLRWIGCIPLGLLFLLCALGNWQILIGGLVRAMKTEKKHSTSLILPFIGPVFGFGFFFLIPVKTINSFFWLAPIIEPTWLMALWCLLTAHFAKKLESSDNLK